MGWSPHLGGQEQLLALASQGLKDALLPHVVGAHVIAVDAQVRVILLYLRCAGREPIRPSLLPGRQSGWGRPHTQKGMSQL